MGDKEVVEAKGQVRESQTSSVDDSDGKELRVVLVGKECQENEELLKALGELDVTEVLNSETGLEFVADAAEYETIFVMPSFQGENFTKLMRAEGRIVGPPVILKCARDSLAIPFQARPLYCMHMKGLIVCFTGFRERDHLCHLVNLVHYMGGSIRKDMSAKVTQLVANCAGKEKYRTAVNFETQIESEEWVTNAWDNRYNLDFDPSNKETLQQFRIKPFFQRKLAFLGFSEEEQCHMQELTVENGGTWGAPGSPDLTHLVVNDHKVKELPQNLELHFFVVREEWFWGSIQMQAGADETVYTFQSICTPASTRYASGSSLTGRSRKRKRLRELAAEGDTDWTPGKRRSSDFGVSMSPNSFLDVSHTPEKSTQAADVSGAADVENRVAPPVKPSARLQVVYELLQTERNYLNILHTILHTFKEQIEKPDQYNDPLLAQQDIKIIFGNVPPIYEVHHCLLVRLEDLVEHWTEEASLGQIFLQHADALMRAYPPFVNFFENTKETIEKCDKNNGRFHAFLKVCMNKPECGRQSLKELLIRPVQRLPSIVLLLTDIQKKTPADNPDHGYLEEAINTLKEVMSHINEDKRKMDGCVMLFAIQKDIENCPVELLSSQRQYITRVDVIEVSDIIGRGSHFTLFLFSDCLLISKQRSRGTGSQKSPAAHKTPGKSYKHVEVLNFRMIRRVLNVQEQEDCHNLFGLLCGEPGVKDDGLYTYCFMLDQEDVNKDEFLTTLCKTIVTSLCRKDHLLLLATVAPDDVAINVKDVNSKFGKAFKFGKRVSRAFSFNKTPSKLKRAMSGVTSAFASPFTSKPRNYTPGGTLQGRRLASTIDLTESSPGISHFDNSDSISLGAYSLQEEPVTTPMVTPHRVDKFKTLGPSSGHKFFSRH